MGVDRFKGQNYDKIKAELLKSGELFKDPEFLPNQKSLFYSRTDNDVVWKRPTDLCNVPKLIVDGASSEDLDEGELGNRWFITACSNLSNHKQLFNKVIPESAAQEYNMQSYTGMFKFQFWVYGKWTEVVVDDLIPTKHGKLIYCHSKAKNEFWSALLEKAYAKLFGDYESMSAGYCVDALVDFTGGVAERYDITADDGENEAACKSMFSQLEEALANNALIVAEVKEAEVNSVPTEDNAMEGSTDVAQGADILVLDSQSPPSTQASSSGNNMEGEAGIAKAPKTGYFRANSIVRDGFMMDCGLLKSHGYNIREVRNISIKKGESLSMIRLQTPWQTGQWMGRWSNLSAEMKAITVQERNKLGLKFEKESDFWMLLSDFLANFTHLDICHFFNTSLFSLKKKWTESEIIGDWVNSLVDNRAGGSHIHPTFLMNPQYLFDITDSSAAAADFSLMVSLEQNDRTLERRGQREAANMCIGFTIMKVEENREYRLHRVGDVVATTEFTTDRSVFHKTPLYAGRYVIVPSTKDPNHVGQFLLRVYSSGGTAAKALAKDEPNTSALCCASAPYMAVQLKVISADGLANDKLASLNPFCVVKCEGDTVKTAIIKDLSSPAWNAKYIFYKKAEGEKKPITIQVFSSQKISNVSLGEATIRDFSDAEGKRLELSLYQKSKKKDQPDIEMPGKLAVHLFSSENLSEF